MKIAYVMSRFPKHTETFILYEMLAIEEQGVSVEVYPLLKQRDAVVHQEALALVKRAHYMPFISLPILASNLATIRRNAALYFSTLLEVLRGTFGNTNYLIGAISAFPKAVHFSKMMLEEKVTHVHAHFSNHPAVAALIVHRLTGIPFSFTAHGHDIHKDRTMLREKITAAAFAVTVSGYNKSLMAKECPPGADSKIHVIHCGVDTRLFRVQMKEGQEGAIKIICVASLLEVKGHTYLIEACKLLQDKGVNFTCHLVGEGKYRARIEKQIKQSGLADRIKLHGACTQSHVRELLMTADIFVLASTRTRQGAREGIPVSLMEGMAVGLPVVASNISGIPELVENGISGFLTPPGDVNALAKSIGDLIEDGSLRKKMGAAAREVILRDFNLESNARQLIHMFQEAQTGNSRYMDLNT
jgi:glycosyltransferase involved in cell wall biosynthesis